MNIQVKTYYDKLASEYDEDRFANSYGQYLDTQEKLILQKWFANDTEEQVLDLGCGTGRFLEFANAGIDISPEMLAVAQKKYSEKELLVSSATDMPFEKERFDTIISFHVLMHLDRNIVVQILEEAHRILKKGGRFVFDIPSKHRRTLTNYKANNWHGANDFTVDELQKMIQSKWKIKQYQGIALFPIHRIPKSIRSNFVTLDNYLCVSPLKKYASYLIFELVKL